MLKTVSVSESMMVLLRSMMQVVEQRARAMVSLQIRCVCREIANETWQSEKRSLGIIEIKTFHLILILSESTLMSAVT